MLRPRGVAPWRRGISVPPWSRRSAYCADRPPGRDM